MGRVVPASALTWTRFDACLRPKGRGADLTKLTFIDALGLVGAAVAISTARDAGDATPFRAPSSPEVTEQLAGMGLGTVLDEFGVDHTLASPTEEARDDVVIPLARVSDMRTVEGLSQRVLSQLERRVHPDVLVTIAEALRELTANALEHSGASALVIGQVYHGKRPDHDEKVQLVVGDTGCGIRESFLRTGLHKPDDDLGAIELAVGDRVSSVRDPGRGGGLHTTISEVTKLAGKVTIRSGTGRLMVQAGKAATSVITPLAGTIVGVNLPLFPGSKRA
ncbi:MAG: hypothetical protein ACYDH6_07495 [Acidimicrobiales bacterium]